MKKVPVYHPSSIGKTKVGEAIIYDDGVIIIELGATSKGDELRKILIDDSIRGLNISGDEALKLSKDDLLSDQISVVDFVEEEHKKVNRHQWR